MEINLPERWTSRQVEYAIPQNLVFAKKESHPVQKAERLERRAACCEQSLNTAPGFCITLHFVPLADPAAVVEAIFKGPQVYGAIFHAAEKVVEPEVF